MKKAKLTPEQVMHIKTTDMRSSHLTLVYDVSISTINHIKSGLAWKKFNTEKNVKRRAMSPAMRLPVGKK